MHILRLDIRKMTAMRADDLERLLAEVAGRHTGNFGLAAHDLTTGEEVGLCASQVFPTASVIKLPILVEFMRQVTNRRLALDERVELRAVDRCGGSGILKALDEGLQLTLRDCAVLMIIVSDNAATNLVIEAVGGVDSVNAGMDELGLSTIRLHNVVDFDIVGSDARRLGEASPRHMCALTQRIAERTVFGPEVSEPVERILAGQQYLDQVPRYMQVAPYARELGLDPQITVANKTGFFPGTRADAGIVRYRGGGGFAYAVASHESSDESFLPEAEGSVLAGLVGKMIVEHWWPESRGPAPTVPTPYAAS